MLQSADYLGDVQGAGAVLEDEAGNAQTAVLLGVVKDGVILPDCQELLEIGEGGGDVLEGHINHCVRDGIEHGDVEKTISDFTKAVERFANMGK